MTKIIIQNKDSDFQLSDQVKTLVFGRFWRIWLAKTWPSSVSLSTSMNPYQCSKKLPKPLIVNTYSKMLHTLRTLSWEWLMSLRFLLPSTVELSSEQQNLLIRFLERHSRWEERIGNIFLSRCLITPLSRLPMPFQINMNSGWIQPCNRNLKLLIYSSKHLELKT